MERIIEVFHELCTDVRDGFADPENQKERIAEIMEYCRQLGDEIEKNDTQAIEKLMVLNNIFILLSAYVEQHPWLFNFFNDMRDAYLKKNK